MVRTRGWSEIILAATALVAVMLVAHGVDAQRRRRRPARTPTVAQARVVFAEVREAWAALLVLQVEPADASGVLRAWDRRWEHRLEALQRIESGACLVGPGTCREHEIEALACNTAFHLRSVRSLLLTDYGGDPHDHDGDGVRIHPPMADRLALANEAARRQREGLSCEDLPETYELHADACGRWYATGGAPLVPGDPPRAWDRCPDAAGDAESDRTAPVEPPDAEAAPVPPASAAPPESGDGSLDLSAARPVVALGRLDLRACWWAVPAAERVETPLRLTFRVEPNGSVGEVEMAAEISATLRTCFESRVRSWRFPTSTTGQRFTIPLLLSPERGVVDAAGIVP